MIRRAIATDIPKLVAFLIETGARTKYHSVTEVDVDYVKPVLHQMIMRHGGRGESGTFAMVSETDGKITGLLFGLKDRIMGICRHLYATDFLYTVGRNGSAKDAVALFDCFVEWARSDPRVLQITEAKHDALPEGHAEKLYFRHGFKKIGDLYELDIDRTTVRSVA